MPASCSYHLQLGSIRKAGAPTKVGPLHGHTAVERLCRALRIDHTPPSKAWYKDDHMGIVVCHTFADTRLVHASGHPDDT